MMNQKLTGNLLDLVAMGAALAHLLKPDVFLSEVTQMEKCHSWISEWSSHIKPAIEDLQKPANGFLNCSRTELGSLQLEALLKQSLPSFDLGLSV